MNKLFRYFSFASVAVLLMFTACDPAGSGTDIENPEQYKQVYMPQANSMPAEEILILKDEVQNITYGAGYGGPSAPASDIKVSFEFTPALADSFNEAQGTDYPLIPEQAFEMEASSAVIPAGERASAPLKLRVNPYGSLELDQPYLLPLSMSSIEGGYIVNPDLETTYFLLTASLDFLDRSGWSVVEVSSEEVNSQGASTLDGDVNTFWHTAWSQSQPDYPHHIIVDMKNMQTIGGFQITNRQNDSRGMTRIRLEGSTDGETWTSFGEFDFEQINDPQRYFIESNPKIRYFKLVALEGPNFFTFVSEIEAF
ncbi:BT_3987 domain-containing protein [Fodinibius salsisoli]|uniref:DUF1735 domain-containing protein n=1 Tax=Fodinibius salsisoli TaxID=2820877 RepID=A0ABT3PQ37_9BACT|nr:DUF1735 domain-containing protein [Fodinibius salsisoli]MCW9707980.1 DUF1735 domain-containing protein [Fodinibius salsisoli]